MKMLLVAVCFTLKLIHKYLSNLVFKCLYPSLAPICSTPLAIPENATVKSTMVKDNIGQEIAIECWEGFEFTDTPVDYKAPVADNTTNLGRLEDNEPYL